MHAHVSRFKVLCLGKRSGWQSDQPGVVGGEGKPPQQHTHAGNLSWTIYDMIMMIMMIITIMTLTIMMIMVIMLMIMTMPLIIRLLILIMIMILLQEP